MCDQCEHLKEIVKTEYDCTYQGHCEGKAHKPDTRSAGQVGVERLVDAREGIDSSAQTGSQLGSLIARADFIYKSGVECPWCNDGKKYHLPKDMQWHLHDAH